jgi:HAD superfamily hydrolase (TIGR01509 family)
MGEGSEPAGIVFDNDGLLLDTEPCWTRAQQTVFERRGQIFDLAAKQALVGTAPSTAPAVLDRLLDPPGQGAEASDEMYELAVDEIAAGAEPRPGALELLRAVRGRWPVAVASNAPRRHLLAGLRRVGIEDGFDVILGVEDVAAPKPAPDLYLRACELLGVDPPRSVAIEDSPPGVAAARAAGMFVVGVPSIHEIVLEADRSFESLSDPDVAATIEAALDGTGKRTQRQKGAER